MTFVALKKLIIAIFMAVFCGQNVVWCDSCGEMYTEELTPCDTCDAMVCYYCMEVYEQEHGCFVCDEG